MGMVDWEGLLSSEKIELEEDTEKVLELSNWRVENREFERQGNTEKARVLVFDVISEDGKKPQVAQFMTGSKRLIKKLQPHVEKAEREDRHVIKIGVIRTGESYNTNYVVRAV